MEHLSKSEIFYSAQLFLIATISLCCVIVMIMTAIHVENKMTLRGKKLYIITTLCGVICSILLFISLTFNTNTL